MRLLLTPTSPYARKVRIVLREKSVPCEEVAVALGAPDSPLPAHNPLAKVPVLILDDGEAVYDSAVIVQHLEAAFPEPPLLPRDARGRMEALRWEALADGICDATVAVVLERRRPEGARLGAVEERQLAKIRRGLEVAEAAVVGRAFLVGDRFGLADAALATAVGYVRLRTPELLAGNCPALAAWAARLDERPSVAETRPAA